MSQYIPIMRRVMPLPVLRVLLLVQGIMVLPFLFYLPLWLGVVFGLVLIWRWRVTHGEMRQAPKLKVRPEADGQRRRAATGAEP